MSSITCPECLKRYRIPASAVGRSVTCTECGKRFTVAAAVPKPAARDTEHPLPKTDDSLWDEDFADSYELANPAFGPASDHGHQTSPPLPVRTQETPSWAKKCDVAFRVVALAVPFALWLTIYVLTSSIDADMGYIPLVLSTMAFLPVFLVGFVLAKKGLQLDAASWRNRAVGLWLVGIGVVCAVLGLAVGAATSYVFSGGYFIGLGGLVPGLCMVIVGGLQIITGRDLRSETIFTRDM